jgi:alpha-tubulin suppressor-like RCC1 family protein
VATVSTTGLITGKSGGNETVTATLGTVVGSTTFTVKAPFSNIATGGHHTLALKADGSLFGWGNNLHGQVGDGTNTNRLVPTMDGVVKTWAALASGEYHSAGIQATSIQTGGALWTWGYNIAGQIGDGTFVDRTAPVKIGTVTTWVAVAAGKSHTLALKKDGTVWAWGGNAHGQLGDGTTIDRPQPVQVGLLKDWTTIAAGDSHTLGRRADGSIWAWGANANGQLGIGSAVDALVPTQIGTDKWLSVAAGSGHTLAIRSDGALFAWGAYASGQLGADSAGADALSPVQVGSDTNWARISAGGLHTLAVKSNGTLWAWGANAMGQLGNGDATLQLMAAPQQIGTATSWLAISAGLAHSLGLQADGTLWSWGSNLDGQLGNGTLVSPVLTPTKLP